MGSLCSKHLLFHHSCLAPCSCACHSGKGAGNLFMLTKFSSGLSITSQQWFSNNRNEIGLHFRLLLSKNIMFGWYAAKLLLGDWKRQLLMQQWNYEVPPPIPVHFHCFGYVLSFSARCGMSCRGPSTLHAST